MNPLQPDSSSAAHGHGASDSVQQHLQPLNYFYSNQSETQSAMILSPPSNQYEDIASHDNPKSADRKRQTKACDGCRIRKRKCDGMNPCSNCLKSAHSADGKVSCTYTSVAKKRGPKKGHKDTLLQRLENLETMLKPLTSAISANSSTNVSNSSTPSSSPQVTISPSVSLNEDASQSGLHNDGRPAKRAHIEDRLTALVNVAEASIANRVHKQSSNVAVSSIPGVSPSSVIAAQPLLMTGNPSNLVPSVSPAATPELDRFDQLQEILSHDSGSFLGFSTTDLLYPSSTSSTLPDLIPAMGDSLPMMNPEMFMNTLNIMFAPPMGGNDQFSLFGGHTDPSQPQPLFQDNAAFNSTAQPQSGMNSYQLNSSEVPTNPVLSTFLSTFGVSNADGIESVTSVELHLIRLSIAFIPLIPLSGAQLKAIRTGENIPSALPRAVRDAMCACTVVFSKHPDLFRDFPDVTVPGLKDRVRLVKLFLSRAEEVLRTSVRTLSTSSMDDLKMYRAQDTKITPISECDAIRAMFFMVLAYYGLGIGAEAMRFSRDACQLAIRVRLSQSYSSTFDNVESPQLQVSSIVTSIPRMKQQDIPTGPYTTEERSDRYRLWAGTITMDTLATMTSGYQFAIDENNYPNLNVGWTEMTNGPIFKIPRVSLSNLITIDPLAKYTIWQNGPLSVMYDNMMQMSAIFSEPDASSDLFENQFKLFLILRKIIRHGWRGSTPVSVPKTSPLASYPFNQLFTRSEGPSVHVLHDSLLMWLSLLPSELKPFEDLEAFASSRDRPRLDQLKKWIYSMSSVQNVLLFLTGFAYLHLPLVSQRKYGDNTSQQEMFPLRPPTPTGETRKLFTSREVLLSIFRALTYIIQKLYSPEIPLNVKFQSMSYDMNEVNSSNMRSLPPDVPSPALCWPCNCFCIFVIGVSGLLAGRTYSDSESESHIYPAAVTATKSVIMPVLERAAEMHPLTSLFKAKLAVFLSGGSPCEWAKEAVK